MLKAIRNTMANYAGGIAVLAATLVFNALYFRMLDDESFGIVSLLLTVTLMLPALDLGTGRTVGRILADRLARQDDLAGLRDAVMTLQVTNTAIGLALGAGLAVAAQSVTTGWLQPESLGTSKIAEAVALIGAVIPLMMAKNFLIAALNGMKRQVLSNALTVSFTLLRGVVALTVLSVGDDPLRAFLISQFLVQAADTLISGAVVWRLLPPANRQPRFELAVLSRFWRFAAGEGAATLIGACLAQGDKLLLSTLLPLSSYGAYALISTVAMGIGRFTSPFSAAFLPHFVELMALNRKKDLRTDYLVATQLLASVILPIAAVMIVFAPEIVAVVLGPGYPPGQLPIAFALLVAATILNNLMHLPHGVQLAAGNSMTALRFTAFNAVAYVALVIAITPSLGVVAPAASLFAIYAVTVVLFTQVTQRILELAAREWVDRAVLRPGAIAVAISLIAAFVIPSETGPVVGTALLVLTALVGSGAALAACPAARDVLLGAIRARHAQATGGSREEH